MANANIEGHLPLKAPVFHILLALTERPLHGYGVMQDVRTRSDGRVSLTTGAFYRHLQKLLDGGLVAESDERPEDDDPRRGAYYALTALGRDVLAAESRRMAGLVAETTELGLISGSRGA